MTEQPGVRVTMEAIWETLQDVRDRVTRIESSTDATANLASAVTDHEKRITKLETKLEADDAAHGAGRSWTGIVVQVGSLAVAALGMVIVLIQAL